jgi:hypothetical protein
LEPFQQRYSARDDLGHASRSGCDNALGLDARPRRIRFPSAQWADINTDADTYSNGYSHSNCHRDSHSYGHANANSYSNRHGHGHANANSYGNRHGHGHANAHSDSYGHLYAYCDSDRDVHANRNSNCYSYSNRNGYSDSHGSAYADANTNAASCADGIERHQPDYQQLNGQLDQCPRCEQLPVRRLHEQYFWHLRNDLSRSERRQRD